MPTVRGKVPPGNIASIQICLNKENHLHGSDAFLNSARELPLICLAIIFSSGFVNAYLCSSCDCKLIYIIGQILI